MITLIEYIFIFLALHFLLNIGLDKKDKTIINKLREEIKHERYNHSRQINSNYILYEQMTKYKRRYREMLQENIRLQAEFKKAVIR